MPRTPFGWPKRLDPVVFVVVALLCAATLVIFLHHRALGAQNRQTTIILQKVAEQTAASAALEVRKVFDGPVFDSLAAITHPTLVDNRLDVVAERYRAGLAAYPQLERFFIWTSTTEARVSGEALFLGRDGRFQRDPALGRHVIDAARHHSAARHIYAAVPANVKGVGYDVFIRIYYTGASRDELLGVLGFVVNLDDVRKNLFPQVHRRHLSALLEPRDGTPRFAMRVLDANGQQVFGPTGPPPAISARSIVAMQFYPAEAIRTRMSAMLPARHWTLVVSPLDGAGIPSTRAQSYWLSGLSVLLMLVALMVAIKTSQRAAQLARMQSEFVAHVSHQLKTPVSLLSAVMETVALDRVRSPEKFAQCMAIMRGQTTRLSALVERILEFSRVTEGRRRYELEAVSLQALVRETVDEFFAAVASSGFTVEVASAGGTPIVAADPAALEQALINLLDNAMKYSGVSRCITVRVGTLGSEAIVEVIDRGIGVPSHERKRILERFYRGAGGALHRNGFGLGLPIAKEILSVHRGTIDVEETPGGGSTFRMRLPMLQDAADDVRARRPLWGWWRREA